MGKNDNAFKFRKHANIGAEGAEEDDEFLFECFVDNGNLEILANTEENKRIVIGRTGSGKTALLRTISHQNEDSTITLHPEDCALNYLSNNTLLKTLCDNNINLNTFFKFLWKHILVTEIVKTRYSIQNDTDVKNFISTIIEKFTDTGRTKREATDYIRKWGDSFWKTVDIKVKEITETLERKSGINTSQTPISANIEECKKSEIKKAIIDKSEEFISGLQIRELSSLIETVFNKDNFSTGRYQFIQYYVIIDRLDEDWVDDKIRSQLILSLIEIAKDFKKYKNIKIIIALRQDLLERILRTRTFGFQEEKYQSMYLKLIWTKDELLSVIEKRFNKLLKSKYTNNVLYWTDVVAETYGKHKLKTFDYVYERTLGRPRDIINYFNIILTRCTDEKKITIDHIRAAEEDYSCSRFKSICDEWMDEYRKIGHASEILFTNKNDGLTIKDYLDDTSIADLLNINYSGNMAPCRVSDIIKQWLTNGSDFDSICKLFIIFWNIGMIGIKIDTHTATRFIHTPNHQLIENTMLTTDSKIYISPMFYSKLPIPPNSAYDSCKHSALFGA